MINSFWNFHIFYFKLLLFESILIIAPILIKQIILWNTNKICEFFFIIKIIKTFFIERICISFISHRSSKSILYLFFEFIQIVISIINSSSSGAEHTGILLSLRGKVRSNGVSMANELNTINVHIIIFCKFPTNKWLKLRIHFSNSKLTKTIRYQKLQFVNIHQIIMFFNQSFSSIRNLSIWSHCVQCQKNWNY